MRERSHSIERNRSEIITFLILFSLFGCTNQNSLEESVKRNKPKFEHKMAVRDVTNFCGIELKNDADDKDLINYFTFKSMDAAGRIENCSMKYAFRLYSNAVKSTEEVFPLPIFEIKGTNYSLLIFNGKGAWASVWAIAKIDRTKRVIESIQFLEEYECTPYADKFKDSSFLKQFVGIEYISHQSTFGAYKNDTLLIEGTNLVDGVSGATTTLSGIIESVNDGLKRYDNYLMKQ